MDHALNRGAPILAEIVGYAENADAMYETEPDPVNVAKCIHKAVEMTREKRPTGVVLNNHGTSTPIGDPAEMTAEANVFEHRQVVGIAAIKSNTGHMLGASGAAEGVMSVKTLEYGMTPPIRNLEDPIDEAKGYEHLMSNEAPIEADIKYVVNNSFGFGGNNAVTIFSKPC
jgi:3-oxoacyl-[acyl-carrier-protein] synthase II